MRGASALQRALERAPSADLDVLVAWEPVIASDTGPPSARTRRRLKDARVTQFWDAERLLSDELIRVARAHPAEAPPQALEPGAVAWDVVLVVPPGARWDASFPKPAWWQAPVVAAEEELAKRLANGGR